MSEQLQLCAQPALGFETLTSWLRAVGKIVGDVRVNGHAWEVATFARVSGYVEQVRFAFCRQRGTRV